MSRNPDDVGWDTCTNCLLPVAWAVPWSTGLGSTAVQHHSTPRRTMPACLHCSGEEGGEEGGSGSSSGSEDLAGEFDDADEELYLQRRWQHLRKKRRGRRRSTGGGWVGGRLGRGGGGPAGLARGSDGLTPSLLGRLCVLCWLVPCPRAAKVRCACCACCAGSEDVEEDEEEDVVFEGGLRIPAGVWEAGDGLQIPHTVQT